MHQKDTHHKFEIFEIPIMICFSIIDYLFMLLIDILQIQITSTNFANLLMESLGTCLSEEDKMESCLLK